MGLFRQDNRIYRIGLGYVDHVTNHLGTLAAASAAASTVSVQYDDDVKAMGLALQLHPFRIIDAAVAQEDPLFGGCAPAD